MEGGKERRKKRKREGGRGRGKDGGNTLKEDEIKEQGEASIYKSGRDNHGEILLSPLAE